MRCLIWAAVSTKAQAAEERASLPQQITDARAVIDRENWTEVHEPLIVDGHSRSYSGISPLLDACADMPQYAALIELARSESFDVLLCRSRDRLGRTDVLVTEVESYLRTHGIQVYSLDMPGHIQNPEEYRSSRDKAGLWTAAIERARAEDEVATLATRYRFGMEGRIRRGLHPNNVPFGYRRGPDGVGQVDPGEARTVRLVYDWFLKGTPIRTIRDRLPEYADSYPKSDAGVRRIITNPYYAGFVSWRQHAKGHRLRPRSEWLMAEGLHEPIIPVETWEQAQRENEKRPGDRVRETYSRYALSGLVYCGLCQGRMIVHSSGGHNKPYRWYACPQCRVNGDRPHNVKLRDLEYLVAEWLCGVAEDSGLLVIEEDTHEDERNGLQAALAQKSAALERWARDYEQGLLPRGEYYQRRLALMDDMDSIEAKLEQLGEGLSVEDVEQAIQQIAHADPEVVAESWRDDETALAVKATLRRIGLRIVVTHKVATIELCA